MRPACTSFRQLFNRRQFLQVGGAGLFGLTWADFFRAQAPAANNGRTIVPKARQAIFIFLAGGPPHQDMFDMKPDQPAQFRGPFRPIRTTVPGLDVCEHLPRLARIADKYTILRSVNSRGYPETGGHFAGLCWKTGNPRARFGTPKYPMFGSVTSKLLASSADVPSFVEMGDINLFAPGVKESYLGPAYNPFKILPPTETETSSTNSSGFPTRERMPDLTQLQVDPADFERQTQLLRSLEQQMRRQDQADQALASLDEFQQRAVNVLRSPRLRQALDLTRETAQIKERYGFSIPYDNRRYNTARGAANIQCPRMLVARRMIEAGVPFVYLDFPYWDWHNGSSVARALPELTMFDTSLSALIEDLDARGLLDTTMVIALGEMGRHPSASMPIYGREHWTAAQFVFAAGGGFPRGAVVGATDARAAYVRDRDYKVASLGKTMYHLLGIDPETELHTTDNRPLKLITEDVPLIREVL